MRMYDREHQPLAPDVQWPDQRWQSVAGEIPRREAADRPSRQHADAVWIRAREKLAMRVVRQRFERLGPRRRELLEQHEIGSLTGQPGEQGPRIRIAVVQVGGDDGEP